MCEPSDPPSDLCVNIFTTCFIRGCITRDTVNASPLAGVDGHQPASSYINCLIVFVYLKRRNCWVRGTLAIFGGDATETEQ